MKTTKSAYAKINLFLDIEGKRENGYHNIISLMQSVSLCDKVTVTYTPSEEKKITVSCSRADIPCNQDNLAYKAAALYPCKGTIEIYIEKNIPMSAGLAGGSTDAAAVLCALNEICGNKLSDEALKTLGGKLGADIPFCIAGGAARVEGIGEILSPMTSMPHFPMVIAKKGEGMSTPAAYRALDEKYNDFKSYAPKVELFKILEQVPDNCEAYCHGLFNIFEETVEPIRPCVGELKSIMQANGAIGAMMSGSGTSVFGIFDREENAQAALSALLSAGADAHLCYAI